MVSGIERIGVAPARYLTETDYQADRDITWLEGGGDFLTFAAGQFMILWPGDAHMPGIAVNHPATGAQGRGEDCDRVGRHDVEAKGRRLCHESSARGFRRSFFA